MTRRGVIRVTLLLLMLPALFILGVVVSGWLLAAPHQHAVGAAPADLAAETVVFPSPSGSAIHGWLVRGKAGKGAVLVLHGIRADRGEMIARLRFLHAEGFGLLAIDLQAHGESPGRHITFGHLEALDAGAAVAFLRQQLPGERIGVIGVSLGGAATLLGPRPLPVDALVLEQVFPDIGSALTNRLAVYIGPFGRWVAPVYEWVMPLVLPIRPEELRPIDHIGEIAAPLLMLAGAEDRYTPLSESRALFARARTEAAGRDRRRRPCRPRRPCAGGVSASRPVLSRRAFVTAGVRLGDIVEGLPSHAQAAGRGCAVGACRRTWPRRIVPWTVGARSVNRFFAFLREFRHAPRHSLAFPSSMQQESALSPSAPSTAPEIAACLAQGGDVWIFGYGSLMWDPGFAFIEARPALLRGYHRSFCVYSQRNRGTPERPGLVLGLDRGGACKGIAYCVPAADAPQALHYLWEREMANRTYHMREVPLATPGGAVTGRTFIVDRRHRNYAGRLSLEETARLILQGIGNRGPCRQYLENTVAELRKLGHLDGPMHRLEEIVKALAAAAPPCAP